MGRILPARWRTLYWLNFLTRNTGSTDRELERDLWNLRYAHRPFKTHSNFIRSYRDGTKDAHLSIQWDEKASWIFLSEALVEGALDAYCNPAFDLLEEVFFWEDPAGAHREFVGRRLQSEVRIGLRRFRRNGRVWDGALPDLGAAEVDAAIAPYRNFNRLQRVRFALLRCDGALFRFDRRTGRGRRLVRSVTEEARFETLPQNMTGFARALGLYLETIESDPDEQRLASCRDLLDRASAFPFEDVDSKEFASEILALIKERLSGTYVAQYDWAAEFVSRQMNFLVVALNGMLKILQTDVPDENLAAREYLRNSVLWLREEALYTIDLAAKRLDGR